MAFRSRDLHEGIPSGAWPASGSHGYTIHLVGICPEPSLKALYESCDAAGRGSLPALHGDEPLGRSRGSSFLVAIRDTGSFMDPRSQKDWW